MCDLWTFFPTHADVDGEELALTGPGWVCGGPVVAGWVPLDGGERACCGEVQVYIDN